VTVVVQPDDEASRRAWEHYQPTACTMVCNADRSIRCTSRKGDCRMSFDAIICDGQALPCPQSLQTPLGGEPLGANPEQPD
jgi:hypothetical protein